MIKNTVLFLVVAAFVAGCTNGEDEKKAQREAKALERKARAQAAINAPLQVKKQQVDGNELLIFKTFFLDDIGLLVEQTCMVWRDLELKTSALRCSGSPQPADF